MDATPLSVATGGIRRYTWELAKALASEFEGDRIHLLSDQPFEPPDEGRPNLECHPGPVSGVRRRWWSLGLPAALRRHHADVFHGTDFAVPYLQHVPAVMTIHDLSPWRDPSWDNGSRLVRHRTPLLLALGATTMIITPTEAIRSEAIRHFGLHPSRIVAVPEAASRLFRPERSQAAEPPYLLYAGTLEPRKNLGVIVEAWRSVRAQCPLRLVLAGRLREGQSIPKALPGIEYAGAVTDEQLARLYANAAAVVYPSLYEGFGLPLLEAMQSGAAVIASCDPALVEVSGGAALHLDAHDVRAWAEAMTALACNPSLAGELRERGLRRAAEFSWPHTARCTREVYREAVRRFHG